MTLKELFSVQADQNKLKSLYLELANHMDFNPYKNNIITDMPKGGGTKNFNEWHSEEKERIERDIKFYQDKLQKDRAKIEAYIEKAPYPESDIIRFRAINNLSWDEIGELVGYSRRSVTRKFYDYIKLPVLPVLPVVSHVDI